MKKKIIIFTIIISVLLLFSCSIIPLELEQVVSNPIITANSLSSPSVVTLATDTLGAKLYYTLDGSNPNPSDIYFGSTYLYGEPFYLYQPTTIKVFAKKNGLEDSEIIEMSLEIEPVSLSKGETHDFNGLEITLSDIFWYQYEDLWGNNYSTEKIALEFLIKNNTGQELDTNPIYAWGDIIEYPSSLQLNELFSSSIYLTNMDVFSGYTLLPSASIVTSTYYENVSDSANSFKFMGEPTFELNGTFINAGYYFEISFNRDDVNIKPIE